MEDLSYTAHMINAYQSFPFFHPLTCYVKSSHALLHAEVVNDRLQLRCPTCGYIQPQEYIPDMMMNPHRLKLAIEERKALFKDISETPTNETRMKE